MKTNTLFVADAGVLSDERLYEAACARSSAQRKEKTDRYRFRRDRNASLGAELLLRHALERLGIHELDYSYGEAGKPYLAGREGVFFSLSHSGDYVLCAVADHELGADIECVKNAKMKIAERFFCTDEYAHIAAQETEEARQALFFRYWTLKESFLKVTGLGLRLPLNQFEVVLNSEIAVVQNVDNRSYFFREYDGVPGCKCAVCAADAPFAAELQQISITDCL